MNRFMSDEFLCCAQTVTTLDIKGQLMSSIMRTTCSEIGGTVRVRVLSHVDENEVNGEISAGGSW